MGTAALAKIGNASAQGRQRSQKMQKAMHTSFRKWISQMAGEKPTFKNLAIFLQQLGFTQDIAVNAVRAVSGDTTMESGPNPADMAKIAKAAGDHANDMHHPETGKGDVVVDSDQQYEVFATAIAMATKQGKIPQKLQKYLT